VKSQLNRGVSTVMFFTTKSCIQIMRYKFWCSDNDISWNWTKFYQTNWNFKFFWS